jgi:hypothetical protein
MPFSASSVLRKIALGIASYHGTTLQAAEKVARRLTSGRAVLQRRV